MKQLLMLSALFLFQLSSMNAQVKYEKEYRLNEQFVPEAAKEFVASLRLTRKIKWYKEEALNKTSIEAKTKHEEKRYSVEFSDEGEIEDIEIIIKKEEISAVAKGNMCQYFSGEYQKFKITKIQLQLSGNSEAMIAAVQRNDFSSSDQLKINYEIVAKVKKDNKFEKAEFLFSESGELLKKSTIVLKNTDNLEY